MQKFDLLWKGIIEDLFEDFIHFFIPDLYPLVDFKKGYEFLEKELIVLSPKKDIGAKYADKLAKVYLIDGKEKWILIHIEVQGYEDKEFSKRMFTYFYRIYDKYQKEIIALAIFADDKVRFGPNKFEYNFYGTKLTYEYGTYKLMEQKEEELRSEIDNPFTLVILSGIYSIKSKKEAGKRFKFKVTLIKLLLESGYTKQKIRKMFMFIDGILSLPEELEIKFNKEINKLQGGKKMGLTEEMSCIGEIAYKKGVKEGVKEGVLKAAENMYKRGFDDKIIEEVTRLSRKELGKIKKVRNFK